MNGNVDINQLKQFEEMKNKMLGKIMEKSALERLGRMRIVDSQLADQVELYLIQLFQAGKLEGTVTDEKLKEILRVLSEKQDFKIKRK